MGKELFRFEFGYGSRYIKLKSYEVTKETKKGYWIDYNSSKKFVLKTTDEYKPKKSFARDNKIDALNDLYIRTLINEKLVERRLESINRRVVHIESLAEEFGINKIRVSSAKWEYRFKLDTNINEETNNKLEENFKGEGHE